MNSRLGNLSFGRERPSIAIAHVCAYAPAENPAQFSLFVKHQIIDKLKVLLPDARVTSSSNDTIKVFNPGGSYAQFHLAWAKPNEAIIVTSVLDEDQQFESNLIDELAQQIKGWTTHLFA